MLRKRLVGVISVKNGWAVQSFSYRRHLPLGKPEVLAENLDRWGVDEILLQCIDRSAQQLGPDLALLERIGKLGLGTPLIYSGGIRSAEEGVTAVKLGADRICIDALLHDAPEVARDLSRRLGAQALIAGMPLVHSADGLSWIDYRSGVAQAIGQQVLSLLDDQVVAEVMAIDCRHEGIAQGFDFNLLTQFPHKEVPLIAFGGLSEAHQLRQALQLPQVAAVAVGNFLNYREHAVRQLKTQLAGLPLRPPA